MNVKNNKQKNHENNKWINKNPLIVNRTFEKSHSFFFFFDKLHLFQQMDIWDLKGEKKDDNEQEYLKHHQKRVGECIGQTSTKDKL